MWKYEYRKQKRIDQKKQCWPEHIPRVSKTLPIAGFLSINNRKKKINKAKKTATD